LLCDAHCHLNFDSFDEDREAVIQRAAAAGVDHILNPGVDLETSQAALNLADQHSIVYAAVGIHPNEADTWNGESLEEINILAKSSKVRAVGEIGLDYYWDRAERDRQKQIFQEQLELAENLGLPVVIHTRDKDGSLQPAMADALDILEDWTKHLRSQSKELASAPGVLHSFSGDLASAERAIGLRFLIGISGPVTFKKATALQELIRVLPLESFLTETDAPFLTPAPHRGRRNEPGYVRLIAEEIARLRGDPAENIFRCTAANAERLFHW
jgi:TatD DNase family protein